MIDHCRGGRRGLCGRYRRVRPGFGRKEELGQGHQRGGRDGDSCGAHTSSREAGGVVPGDGAGDLRHLRAHAGPGQRTGAYEAALSGAEARPLGHAHGPEVFPGVLRPGRRFGGGRRDGDRSQH